MSQREWSAVDDYIAAYLLGENGALNAALANNHRQGLLPIDISPAQGKMLHLFARMVGAKRILEVGTLGGYSTIWLARALPDDGQLVTLELDEHHAEVARENIENAELSGKVEVIIGPAIDSLRSLPAEQPFDFTFIDADKQGNVDYMNEAIRLSRPGATIVVDNVVREGGVLDGTSDDERIIGTRALFEILKSDVRVDATATQTVGSKGWDGFLLATVL